MGRRLRSLALRTFPLVAMGFVVGCGVAISSAEQLAVEACGLTPPNASEGEGWVSSGIDLSNPWSIASPITRLLEEQDNWDNKALTSRRAEQRDNRFALLSETASENAEEIQKIVIWAQSDPEKHSKFSSLPGTDYFVQEGWRIHGYEEIDAFNSNLFKFELECKLLAEDLNER